ncbi:MAG: hypothetical protein KKB85_03760 [Candidatus Altiarchaeota archaeon]|nr:hypothetical protein [Candidatus Altiarchaeota archaeon]
MLHASISGSIDRNVYALLEKAFLDQEQGKKPMLPIWLSPTQVRILPVSEEFNSFAEELSNKFESSNIRADIDDRNESIGKKIREAEKNWVPRIIVVGEKEKKSGKLSVRVRETGEQKEFSPDELIVEVSDLVKGFPFKRLPLPKLLSRRAKFVG